MEKERKILIIVENLPVPFDTRVWQEATTLAANGYTVSVICPVGKGYMAKEETLDGVHIFRHPLPPEGNGAIGYFREYGSALREELRLAKKVYREIGFDVIHGCNPQGARPSTLSPGCRNRSCRGACGRSPAYPKPCA